MKHTLTALLLIASALCRSQCPSDICEDAIEINLCGAVPGDVICIPYELCNGYHNGFANITYCDDENGGDPSGCSSSTSVEYDFWIRLQVCQDFVYTVNFDSDYFNYQFDDIDGGAQMWIYDNCSNLQMIETALCDNEQEQNLFIDVYLEAGEYVVQVDGFGASVGCGTFCVYMQGFLGTGINELTRSDVGRVYLFNILGQRIKQ